MKTIAFDVMGNDNGVRAGVEAAVEFVDKHLDYNFILIGSKKEINSYLKETERIRILNIPKTIDKNASALSARKGDTSMAKAIQLVVDGEADAVVSSGDSGIYLSMATLMLKRLSGIKRPAFMPVFPTIVPMRRFVLLDAGANIDTTGEMLAQWAKLGSAFSKAVLKEKNPKVAVVNVGTEDKKGKDFHKEAADILSKDKTVNFVGYEEPRDLLDGVVDVAVVDGYAGNMILKSMEGAVLSLLTLMKKELTSKTKYKMGALLAKGAFQNIKETLDYRNVGAAWLIGLNGLAIKCHGGADKKSYAGAFKQVYEALEANAIENFREAMGA